MNLHRKRKRGGGEVPDFLPTSGPPRREPTLSARPPPPPYSSGYSEHGSPQPATSPPLSSPVSAIDQGCVFIQVACSSSRDREEAYEAALRATKRVLLRQAIYTTTSGAALMPEEGPPTVVEKQRERIDRRLDDELESGRRIRSTRTAAVFDRILLPLPHQPVALRLPHLELLWPGGCLIQGRTRWNGDSSVGGDTTDGKEGTWLVSSDGLTDPDLPTRFRLERFRIRPGDDEGGMMMPPYPSTDNFSVANDVIMFSSESGPFLSTVSLRPRLELDPSWSGYGYEIAILTRGKQTWASNCLSFMVRTTGH